MAQRAPPTVKTECCFELISALLNRCKRSFSFLIHISHKVDEIEKWDSGDFDEKDIAFADGEVFSAHVDEGYDVLFAKHVLTNRFRWSNAIVANCVRDGRLITVVKKGPSPWARLKRWTRDHYPDYIDGLDSLLMKSPPSSPP